MVPYNVILAGAGKAAAERQKRALAEGEERMSQYTREDLDGEYEFKIVRADTPAFRKKETLDRLLEEEARAGWTMLEKLDDYRIRFKRPSRARSQDAYLDADVDPYRTHYGASRSRGGVGLALLVGGLLVLAAVGALILVMSAKL
jgi:hypothetical protein